MKRRRKNPSQLCVIENSRHANAEAARIWAQFVGRDTADGKKKKLRLDDGRGEVERLELVWLGRCPAVSWLDDAGKKQRVKVNDAENGEPAEYLDFVGHRITFRGGAKPYVCFDLDKQEVVLIGQALDRLPEGELGPAPCVEYEMPWAGRKGIAHFTHQCDQFDEPTLMRDGPVCRYVGGAMELMADEQGTLWLEH